MKHHIGTDRHSTDHRINSCQMLPMSTYDTRGGLLFDEAQAAWRGCRWFLPSSSPSLWNAIENAGAKVMEWSFAEYPSMIYFCQHWLSWIYELSTIHIEMQGERSAMAPYGSFKLVVRGQHLQHGVYLCLWRANSWGLRTHTAPLSDFHRSMGGLREKSWVWLLESHRWEKRGLCAFRCFDMC